MRQPSNVESRKKPSRKALRNADQRGPLAAVLAAESVTTSRSGSRNGSRNGSRVASRAASRAPSSLAASDDESRPASPDVRLSYDEDDSELDDGGDSEPGRSGIPVLSRAVEILSARKRSNKGSRLSALRSLTQTLRSRYLGGAQSSDERSAAARQVLALVETLASTVQRSDSTGPGGSGFGNNDGSDGDDDGGGDGDGDEKQMALEALTVAMLSCPSTASDKVFADVAQVVRHACHDPSNSSRCAATAVRTLGIVALFGGGTDAMTQTDLLRFLLEIVQTDGASVHHLDDAAVVTAALQTWAFVASYLVSAIASTKEKDAWEWKLEAEANESDSEDGGGADDNDEDGKTGGDSDSRGPSASDGDEEDDGDDFLVAHSLSAFEAFVDQLESTDMNVQLHASVAIGLLFEASRAYQARHHGRPLPLRRDPADLAQEMRLLARGGADSRSTKAVARKLRRHMRESFTNVATSLEYGVGPGYRPSRPTLWAGPKARGMALDMGENQDTTSFQSSGLSEDDLAAPSGAGEGEAVFSHQNHLRVRNHDTPIDTWALDVRVELLRSVLRGGFTEHLASNPAVCAALEASQLQRREKGNKATRKPRKKPTRPERKIEQLSSRKIQREENEKARALAAQGQATA